MKVSIILTQGPLKGTAMENLHAAIRTNIRQQFEDLGMPLNREKLWYIGPSTSMVGYIPVLNAIGKWFLKCLE